MASAGAVDSSSAPSSPLSSLASSSPAPPDTYNHPSPPSSYETDTRGSSEALEVRVPDHDEPPAAKRRKVYQPKPRTTEYLDLGADGGDEEHIARQNAQLRRLVENLRGKKKIVVIAGAGISVSAGIPDFRSSTGLFTTLRSAHNLKSSGKELFDASVYKSDASTTNFHSMVRELSQLTQKAQPTAFHHMIASLAKEDRLLRLYTQNIDCIDTSLPPLATTVPLNAKAPWPKTIQLHGGLDKMMCAKCKVVTDFDGALFNGPKPPSCSECVGMDQARAAVDLRSRGVGKLRPRMVLYNEFNEDSDAIGAVSSADLKSRPDAVIVVGTSLKVPGIRRLTKELCSVTRGRSDGFTAWINHDPEPGSDLKDCWDLVVKAECDEVARQVALPRWDDNDIGRFGITPEDVMQDTRGLLQGVIVPACREVSPTCQVEVPKNAFIEIAPKSKKLLEPGIEFESQDLVKQATKTSKAKAPREKKEKKAKPVKEKQEKPKIPRKPRGVAKKKPSAPPPKSTQPITSRMGVSRPDLATEKQDTTAGMGHACSPLTIPVTDQMIKCSKAKALMLPNAKPMEPIPASDKRNNSDTQVKVHHRKITAPYIKTESGLREVPETPPQAESRAERLLTISPPSKPSGMGHLIE